MWFSKKSSAECQNFIPKADKNRLTKAGTCTFWFVLLLFISYCNYWFTCFVLPHHHKLMKVETMPILFRFIF